MQPEDKKISYAQPRNENFTPYINKTLAISL